MNRFARIGFVVLALSLGVLLAGCEGFDPTSFMDSDFFNTKKRLPGERKPVFPEGTPGVTRASKARESGHPAGAQSANPSPGERPGPNRKPKPKPKVAARPK